MRRIQCWTLAFLVILGLAVPASAQRPSHDPYALTVHDQLSAMFQKGKYCIIDHSIPLCMFNDVASCVKATRKAREDRTIPDASCKPNTNYIYYLQFITSDTE